MGRKTYDSIGRPLPGRRNLVITRNTELKIDGVEVYTSLKDALGSCSTSEEIFIIGGSQIFKESLPLANKLYLTWIHPLFPGDVYFPEFESFLDAFKKTSSQLESEPFVYEFADYIRKN